MDNTNIDDERIQVYFSQSVAKLCSQYQPRNRRRTGCFNNSSVDGMKQQEEDTSTMVYMVTRCTQNFWEQEKRPERTKGENTSKKQRHIADDLDGDAL